MSAIAAVGSAFLQSVLPVVLSGGLGYLVGRARSLDLAPITGLTVLVLAPAVVFDSLARAALPREVVSRLVVHVILQLAAIWLLTVVAVRVVAGPGTAQEPFLLAALFSNAGNVGLPLALFAFGPDRAGHRRRLVRHHVHRRQPAGAVPRRARPPGGARRPGARGAATDDLLLLVGLQLARLAVREEAPAAALAAGIRLLAVPPLAWGAGKLVGLEGLALAVAAVTSALWALEIDARPALVSAAVVLSTVLSVVTLTVCSSPS